MIITIFKVALLRLSHSALECVVIFVVPLIFFSVFALIFDGQASGSSSPTEIIIGDLDRSRESRALAETISQQSEFQIVSLSSQEGVPRPDKLLAIIENKIELGWATAAVVIPKNYAKIVKGPLETELTIELITDTSDPMAEQVVQARVAQIVSETRLTAALMGRPKSNAMLPPVMSKSRRRAIESFDFIDDEVVEADTERVEVAKEQSSLSDATHIEGQNRISAKVAQNKSTTGAKLVSIRVRDLLSEEKVNPRVSMHAAGIAVMFLLFGAVGAAGTLLEEEETGTLERLLSTKLLMGQMLLGKWLFLVVLGFVQVSIMFVWGQFAFGIDLLGHLAGFCIMTIATSAAAASFALVLATACRSRTQLNGVAVIVILCLSAIGGSMVPRYIMSQDMRDLGLLSFNSWALDGYEKVFWRELSMADLIPELAVLGASSIVFLLIARVLARRWESV